MGSRYQAKVTYLTKLVRLWFGASIGGQPSLDAIGASSWLSAPPESVLEITRFGTIEKGHVSRVNLHHLWDASGLTSMWHSQHKGDGDPKSSIIMARIDLVPLRQSRDYD